MYLRSSVSDIYNILVETLLQKISAMKDRKNQAIQSIKNSYFPANKNLPEHQTNVEYESMIREKKFILKLLQLTIFVMLGYNFFLR